MAPTHPVDYRRGKKAHVRLNRPTFEYDAKRALSDFLANAEMIANDAIRGGGLMMPRG